MRRTAIVGVLTLVIAMVQAPAFAYLDTGHDADDVPGLDIRSTSRRVWRADDGRRRLRIAFRAYEPLGFIWRVNIRIDSKGGPAWDFKMRTWNFDQSGRGCVVFPRGHPGQAVRGHFVQLDGGVSAKCRVFLAFLESTKRVRWNLHVLTEPPAEGDFAPDFGFYPTA